MKKLMIEILAVVFIAAVFAISGCASQQTVTEPVTIQKTFFDRTISYTVDPEARDYMARLERLLNRVYKKAEEDTVPGDEAVLPLYRDADINRDHHISLQESKNFYTEYTIQFENSLGPARYRLIK